MKYASMIAVWAAWVIRTVWAISVVSLALSPILSRAQELPQAQPEAQIKKLAQSPYWLRLLHYKPRWPFLKKRSLVRGDGFFFSPEGRSDPKAEMIETIRAFSKDMTVGRLNQPPQCAFPERYRFLKSELHLNLTDIPCPKLDEFMGKFKARSATLVFSSAYPNNPGSMFGHIFLKIRSETRPDILDYGVSYAALVGEDESSLAFMVLGLTGGYKGQFSMQPYYAKVNEYSNSESRDIWEYDLNLTPDETERLLKHVWEIETNSWFDYYFFDENCAYQILAALEVARSDWDLTDLSLFVIPGEAIKKVAAIPGAVTGIHYRPSLRKKTFKKYDLLTSPQKDDFFGLIHFKKEASSVSEIPTLRTSIAYLQYLKQKEGGKLQENESQLLKQLLVRRSSMGDSSPSDLQTSTEEGGTRPDLGHYPSRLGVSSGVLQSAEVGKASAYFQELSFKFAYHDLLNSDLGYTRFSHIDFPGITLRYIPVNQQFYVENLTAVSITSLFPLTFLEKRFSWRLLLDYYTPKDFGLNSSHALRLQSGGGATLELFTPRAIAYALLLADIEAGSVFNKGYRFAPRVELATLLNPFEAYKVRMAADAVTDLFQSDRQSLFYEFNFDQSLSFSRTFEVRILVSYYLNTQNLGYDSYRDAKLTLNYYF